MWMFGGEKCPGDAILCIYGAPVVNDSHATVAVKAAVDALALESACFVNGLFFKRPRFLNLCWLGGQTWLRKPIS